MPKPFPITIDVEEIAVGKIMRRLNHMEGVVSVHMDMADRKQRNGVTPTRRKREGQSGLELLMEILAKADEPVNKEKMREAFRADGRSEKSVENQLFKARKSGLVNNPETGLYTLSAKGKAEMKRQEAA